MALSFLDNAIIWIGIIATSLIGVYFSKYSKSVDGFFVAGRKMNFSLVLASMLASWHGISFYLWLPGAVYSMGWGGWVVTCGTFCIIDMAMGYFFAFKARMIGQYTVPDLFGKAFGKKAQLISGIAYFLYMGVFASAEVLAIALVLNFVFGMSTSLAIVLSAAFVIVYCFTAGQYAVFITDFVQYLLMALGLGLLCVFSFGGVMGAGNTELLAKLAEVWKDPLQFTPISNYSVTQVIGFGITGLGAIMSPLYFSRAFSAKSAKVARDGILCSLYAMVSHDWMLMVIGIASVVLLGASGMENAEQATLYLSAHILPMGICGIVFAALVSAGLSTVNSSFISGASNLGRDIYQKFINPKATQKQIVNVGRIGIVFQAVLTVVISLFADSLVQLSYLIGQVAQPIFIVPILAIFFHRKPKTLAACLMAMGIGAITSVVWLLLGEPDLFHIPMPAGMFGLIGSTVGYFVGNCIGKKRPDVWHALQRGEAVAE
ncbi:MAG: sodium:solute symporter family protein [Oscillospiraceae bacterium]|nr:sodium:solute symporter family protein [Oscillospiraceae bacterium]